MTIIGFCNPLLDISLSNNPEIRRLLTKYELKDNDIILAEAKHEKLIEEMIETGKVEYSPGGAGLNSLRCAQVFLMAQTCRIVGSIGSDSHSQILIKKSLEAGLLTSFQQNSPKPTGKCACLIHGSSRSLVAYLGAANDFNVDHLETVKDQIKSADILYITGFFYSVSPESFKRILDYQRGGESKLIFNLSATFVPDMITEEDFNFLMASVHILIGNSDEFEHLKRRFNHCNLDIRRFAEILVENNPKCLIIITQGSEPVLLFSSSSSYKEIPVPPVEKVVDTNGAGDAFVGGILCGLEKGFPLIKSIKIGCHLAGRVISQKGLSNVDLDTFNDNN